MKINLLVYDWTAFFILLFFTILLLYQSWVNLIKITLTNFSLDALMMLYLRLFRGKKIYERYKELILKEPKRIKLIGFCTLLAALGGIYVTIDWFLEYLLPYLR